MPTPDVLRIAMWSGPRNISTAMMRSWEARPDTFVCDEPLYAAYLKRTGDRRHPGFDETIAAGPTDWRLAVERLLGPTPGGEAVFYQKQMAHHLLPEIDRAWTDHLENCFLIREPAAVLASLTEFFPDPRPEDTGLPQQVELFERVRQRTGATPPVIDSRDVLRDPPGVLAKLCAAVGAPFTEAMLSWPPGPRETDGAWAPLWYKKVYKTTGFGPPREEPVAAPPALGGVLAECRPLYRRLAEHRITT